MTYDWADNFTKSWDLWRSTKRDELLSNTGPKPVTQPGRDAQAVCLAETGDVSPNSPQSCALGCGDLLEGRP